MTDFRKYNSRQFDFGCRYGHIRCLRKEALKIMSAEEVASLPDDMIAQKFIDLGFIPVKVSFEEDDEEIYLISDDVLNNAIRLSR